MTMHGETGVRVLQLESQMALEHAEEPTAVVLARYRELLLAPFDELRRDYEAYGDRRVAGHLDQLLRTARGHPAARLHGPPPDETRLTEAELRALNEAYQARKK